MTATDETPRCALRRRRPGWPWLADPSIPRPERPLHQAHAGKPPCRCRARRIAGCCWPRRAWRPWQHVPAAQPASPSATIRWRAARPLARTCSARCPQPGCRFCGLPGLPQCHPGRLRPRRAELLPGLLVHHARGAGRLPPHARPRAGCGRRLRRGRHQHRAPQRPAIVSVHLQQGLFGGAAGRTGTVNHLLGGMRFVGGVWPALITPLGARACTGQRVSLLC